MKHGTPPAVALLLAALAGRPALAAAVPFGPVVAPRPITELVPAARLRVGKTADWVTVTEDAVWTGSTGPYAVHHIDPARNRRVATVKLPGEPCAGITTGFGSLWVPLCGKPTRLARVDLASNRLTAVFRVGPAGAEGGVAAGAGRVWLLVDRHGTLAGIDPQTGIVRERFQVPAGSYNPLYSGGLIWVTRAEGAEVNGVDPASGRIVATAPTGPKPRFLAGGDGLVWTLNQGDGSLTRVDATAAPDGPGPRETGAVTDARPRAPGTRQTALGTPGSGGDVALGGGMVWTTMPKVPLSATDAATGVVKCQWTGPGGDSLAIGHGAIWLTDYQGGTLSRLDLADTLARCAQP